MAIWSTSNKHNLMIVLQPIERPKGLFLAGRSLNRMLRTTTQIELIRRREGSTWFPALDGPSIMKRLLNIDRARQEIAGFPL